MVSVKLNKTIREEISLRLMRHRFHDKVLTCVEAARLFAKVVYEDIYSASERKLMEQLPEGWLSKSNQMYITFGGEVGYCHLSYNGTTFFHVQDHTLRDILAVLSAGDRKSIERVGPLKHRNRCVGKYEQDHPLTLQAAGLLRGVESVTAEYSVAKQKLTAVLASYTTVGALLKDWPELEPFTRDLTPARVTTKNLPAVDVSTLNQMFDLPVDEKETVSA